MEESRWLARYATLALAVVGGLEWLLGRTVSRLASAPPLQGTARDIIEGLGRVGYFLVSPTFMLVALLVLLAALQLGASVARGKSTVAVVLASYLAVFAVFAVAHTLLEQQAWLNITFNLLSALAIWWLAVRFLFSDLYSRAARLGVLLLALAWTGWYLYVLRQLLGDRVADAGQWDLAVLSIGELLAVLAPFAFFMAVVAPAKSWGRKRRWVLPVVLALVFAAGNIADTVFNQGFTGVFTTWSLGFNLLDYGVPFWPLYAVSAALFFYSMLTAFASDGITSNSYANPNTGFGLFFLLLATYSLQVQYQHLLALLSVMLLTGTFVPFAPREEEAAQANKPLLAGKQAQS